MASKKKRKRECTLYEWVISVRLRTCANAKSIENVWRGSQEDPFCRVQISSSTCIAVAVAPALAAVAVGLVLKKSFKLYRQKVQRHEIAAADKIWFWRKRNKNRIQMRKLKIKISMTCVLGCVCARVIKGLEAIEDYCVQRSSINWNAFDRSRYSKLCQKDE